MKDKTTKKVIVVGAGISGLMDAFFLFNAGFKISLYAKGPDPRKTANITEQYSSTRGGGPGRFISRFEGEHYLGDSPMYPDMKGAFQNHVSQGGWLGKHPYEFTKFDKKWLTKRSLASDDKNKMQKTEKFYVEANGKAMQLWQEMISKSPELFKDVDLLNTGILRLYDNPILFNWAIKRHKKESVLERTLSLPEVSKEYPYFSEAVKRGYLRGGGIEAPGFSFNIHKFTDNLINFLELQGVEFNWNKEISKIKLSKRGLVMGLMCKNNLITADCYSINPGAYSDERFFKRTPAEGKIAGVVGRWMYMPSPKNFKRPVKIHGGTRIERGKKFPVVDINLTHFVDADGKEKLAVGGGYAYIGKTPFNLNNPAFKIIDAENRRTVRRFLGPTYREALKKRNIQKSDETCARSFTYDDIPVMDNMKTVNRGILRINIGTNTGTTTISPLTAQETVRAFSA
ncbi:MAG: FAD-dependent oxidoreductase [bacterium]|nr:FAD-dependent oxidoreductase [bacterium]